jgi:putative mRNA 3-end processing factor
MLSVTDLGLFCAAGDFYIDPWRAVPRALITHAHSDHARSGCGAYLCSGSGVGVLRSRMGAGAVIEGQAYGVVREMGGVRVSFHPAGHVLGSAQIRLELGGEVWVVSGDYKRQRDPTCTEYEPVKCHTFITESTFGLPIYRWEEPERVVGRMRDWWVANQSEKLTTVMLAYSLGKAQRLLASLGGGPLFAHKAVMDLLPAYAAEGVDLSHVRLATREAVLAAGGRGLVVAPPAVEGSAWLAGLGDISCGVASGWMQIRGARRRRAVEGAFVISDHADWPGLIASIKDSCAERVLVTHGATGPLVRWLREGGWKADPLKTQYGGDEATAEETPHAPPTTATGGPEDEGV